MRVISKKIIDRLKHYMDNRPEQRDTVLDVLSISNSYGNTNEVRDRIVMEGGILKYQLFGTDLFVYRHNLQEGFITTAGYESATTSSRVKDLLSLLFTNVSVRKPYIFIGDKSYEYAHKFTFQYKNGGMYYTN